MATTYSTAYGNTPDEFQKRVYAQLNAQSIAIAAALALAAKNDEHQKDALSHQIARIVELNQTNLIMPIDDRDRKFAESHLSDIFAEARKMLAIKFEWDKAPEA